MTAVSYDTLETALETKKMPEGIVNVHRDRRCNFWKGLGLPIYFETTSGEKLRLNVVDDRIKIQKEQVVTKLEWQ